MRPFSLIFLSISVLCFACSPSEPNANDTQSPTAEKSKAKPEDKTAAAPTSDADSKELVIYSGRSASLVEPLFKQFEAKTGIKVKARFDKSTATLANRIATEAEQTEADIFFAQDSGYLGALGRAGHLAQLPDTILSQVPADRRSKAGHWVATSARARVLVYSPERVKPEELPATIEELADAKWTGRLGWAPGNSSFQAHVSALRSIWGEEKTKKWLGSMAAIKPVVYPKNSPQVKAVSSGEIDIGWVNHYYLHKLKAANPSLKAANYSFRTAGDAGNILMLSGVAMVSHAKNKASAQAFVTFLLSEEAQNYFAQKGYEYPMRPGIKTHPDVPPGGIGAASVSQEALADVAGTVSLLRSLGLL